MDSNIPRPEMLEGFTGELLKSIEPQETAGSFGASQGGWNETEATRLRLAEQQLAAAIKELAEQGKIVQASQSKSPEVAALEARTERIKQEIRSLQRQQQSAAEHSQFLQAQSRAQDISQFAPLNDPELMAPVMQMALAKPGEVSTKDVQQFLEVYQQPKISKAQQQAAAEARARQQVEPSTSFPDYTTGPQGYGSASVSGPVVSMEDWDKANPAPVYKPSGLPGGRELRDEEREAYRKAIEWQNTRQAELNRRTAEAQKSSATGSTSSGTGRRSFMYGEQGQEREVRRIHRQWQHRPAKGGFWTKASGAESAAYQKAAGERGLEFAEEEEEGASKYPYAPGGVYGPKIEPPPLPKESKARQRSLMENLQGAVEGDMQSVMAIGAKVGSVAALAHIAGSGISSMGHFAGGEGVGNTIDSMMGFGSDAVGKIGGGAMAGFSLAGPPGAAVGAVVGAASAIASLPQSIMNWTEALLDSQKHLAAFSGTLQQSFGEARARGILRDIQTAAETEGRTSQLSSAYQDLLDEVRPIRSALTNDLMMLLRPLVAGLTGLTIAAKETYSGNAGWLAAIQAGPLTTIIKALHEIEQHTRDQTSRHGTMGDLLMETLRNPTGAADRARSARVPRMP